MAPTRYRITRTLLAPRIALGRRRHRDDGDIATAFDNGNYRSSLYRFLDASITDPGLLTHTEGLDQTSVVLDVGAYVGRWGGTIADRVGCTVYAFELSPVSQPRLEVTAASRPSLVPQLYGLGARDEDVRISRRELGSSVFGSADDAALPWDTGRIRDIAAVWQELGLERVALMKINIEGGEYDLLERMIGTGLIDRVDRFQIQFHEWLPRAHRRRRAIRRALAQTHELEWDYPFVWERWLHHRLRPADG